MIIVVAMWVVLVLAGIALAFTRAMRVELRAAADRLAVAQAEWAARGALAFALARVAADRGEPLPAEDFFPRAVPVGESWFWLLRPRPDDPAAWDYGLVSESAKVNLNEAEWEMLLMLPGMTDELAASIIDWRSPEPSGLPGGAGSEYYLLGDPPYQCKHGPFDTVEELLLVRGADMELLFGGAGEFDGRQRGLYDFLTVWSSERGVSGPENGDSVNVNRASTGQLSAFFAETVPADRLSALVTRVRRGRPYRNLLDLFYHSELPLEEFQPLAGRVVFRGRNVRRDGLINVNTAPAEVLQVLPGLEPFDVEMLLARRAAPDADLSSPLWVAEVLEPEKALLVADWLTTSAYQFSADILAVSGDGRARRRYRAVLDGRPAPPRVLSWQELTALGWPLDPAIPAALAAGEEPLPLDQRHGFY